MELLLIFLLFGIFAVFSAGLIIFVVSIVNKLEKENKKRQLEFQMRYNYIMDEGTWEEKEALLREVQGQAEWDARQRRAGAIWTMHASGNHLANNLDNSFFPNKHTGPGGRGPG